jgi:hypothetical protein
MIDKLQCRIFFISDNRKSSKGVSKQNVLAGERSSGEVDVIHTVDLIELRFSNLFLYCNE